MVTYPISVKRNGYRGSDPRKRAKANEENRIALELERHINKLVENQQLPIQNYMYHEIARATGHDVDLVRRICFSIDGGHHGFTVIKQGMTLEQAMAELHAPASK
jgi:hypothetical protein